MHYAWIITLGCGLVTFYTVGLAFNCISVFLNPLMESLGISNTLRSSMTMFYQSGSVLSLLAIGPVTDKIGTRRSILYFSIFMALGYVMLAIADTVYFCYLAMFIIGIGYGLCGLVPVSMLLTEWFAQKRGFALGAAMCGSGVATIIAPTLVTNVIAAWGVHSAFVVQASIITICAIIAFAILRDKPSDVGMLPYGGQSSLERDIEEKEHSHQLKLKDAIKDVRFVMMVAVMLMSGGMISPMVQHLSPIISQSGYGEHLAAMAVSIYGTVMLVGKPVFGTVIDKFGILKANTYAYAFLMIALIDGVFLSRNEILIYGIPLFLGMGSAPLVTVGLPIWVSGLFGKVNMASIFAMLKLCYTLGGMIGASIPGIVIDHTGSYTDLFKLYIVVAIITYVVLQGLFMGNAKKESA